jgi:hypothetical protein
MKINKIYVNFKDSGNCDISGFVTTNTKNIGIQIQNFIDNQNSLFPSFDDVEIITITLEKI